MTVVLRRALLNTRKETYMATKSKKLPTELLNKYYARGVELCDAETSIFCYCGRLATGLHTMHCSRFASKVKAKCKELAKAAGEVW